ncbi:glutathione peroxidase [Propionispora hippei]|uniref:Glutathione peroxidase n=1 Tax=Propionispora hippei DSM 15287 TaxID=1123003 RepID=A0A1M6E0T9_9FIRM|nr:glutathione peroxidase [Propionispora hippei]SHI79134.1 glutathione peroxidase [Propionispora hippei DSM 15287]
MNIYDFQVKTIDGKTITLAEFKGRVLLIVNTASKCGFTPQYEELQALYQDYAGQGLEILGFPSNQFAEQEPGSNEEVQQFCQLTYGVSFPMFEKTEVRGKSAHPLFVYLTEQAPFRGFDAGHPIAGKLEEVLKERFPELLEGDGIKWNFTKFLVNREGKVVGRYEPTTSPSAMRTAIEKLL